MKFPCQLPTCPAYILYLTDITTYIPFSLPHPDPEKTPKQAPALNETFNQVNETLKASAAFGCDSSPRIFPDKRRLLTLKSSISCSTQ